MNSIQSELNKLSKVCLAREFSIAAAESVTAGYLQFLLSQMPNATQIFNGGITTYNIGQKVKHLGLDYTHGNLCNCVSGPTAQIMADQTSVLFNCKVGIALTGYASTIPEEGINELYAYLGISLNGENIHLHKLYSVATSAVEAQKDYAHQSIIHLHNCISKISVK